MGWSSGRLQGKEPRFVRNEQGRGTGKHVTRRAWSGITSQKIIIGKIYINSRWTKFHSTVESFIVCLFMVTRILSVITATVLRVTVSATGWACQTQLGMGHGAGWSLEGTNVTLMSESTSHTITFIWSVYYRLTQTPHLLLPIHSLCTSTNDTTYSPRCAVTWETPFGWSAVNCMAKNHWICEKKPLFV